MIGLIGGMSWESTVEYYRIMNELVKEKLGGWNSAEIILYSVNFEEIVRMQRAGEWGKLGEILGDIAVKLEEAGAKAVLICTNTMHKVADDVERRISIPLINIIDVTAEALKRDGVKRAGLLGTKFTMEDGFYQERMKRHGIEIIVPEKEEDRDAVHSIIFDELCLGIIKEESERRLRRIVSELKSAGAEGIILGCTELPLILKDPEFYDTTKLHAEAAVNFLLNG
ncbi:MAG: aspartate/glutamate racemase family protein [Archaeoglobus sp.]|uniref:aspartate/glutamate racemase family protein n=1 Tax=Archaeoglobus sp. TaxID=1872626 RepID=UPI001D71AC78|nr:aspartate/glutamate racemase family protein [Archaeoglobus sp.]MBO8180398.1 aspartate/glutamate racemase family protein [Archaeoglobus sp.]